MRGRRSASIGRNEVTQCSGLFCRESAQESYSQQVGAAPPTGIGAPKQFDPARSKTLQLLKEQEEEARHRPLTPHSATCDEPSRDDVHPNYQGYVNPNTQSQFFKRIGYCPGNTGQGGKLSASLHSILGLFAGGRAGAAILFSRRVCVFSVRYLLQTKFFK